MGVDVAYPNLLGKKGYVVVVVVVVVLLYSKSWVLMSSNLFRLTIGNLHV